jgi:hypothetical protein
MCAREAVAAWRHDNTGLDLYDLLYECDELSFDDVNFEVIGHGCERVALLGPDGIVYKVPYYGDTYQQEAEVKFFAKLNEYGLPWCPDYWVYESEGVIAMRHYARCPRGLRQRQAQEAIESVCPDADFVNLGQDDDGRVVLLDGGVSSERSHEDLHALAETYSELWQRLAVA